VLDTTSRKQTHFHFTRSHSSSISHSLQIGDGETIVNNVPTKRNVEDDDSQQEDFNCCSRNTLRIQTAVYSCLKTHTNLIKTVIKTVLFGVFFAYLVYSFYYKFGGEPEWRLLVCTIIGLSMIIGFWLSNHFKTQIKRWQQNTVTPFCARSGTATVMFHIRW
jgi:hypothetical protein